MLKRFALVLLAAITLGAPTSVLAQDELLMFEQPGCHWCALWNAQIAPIYPKTPEGQAAPLRRLDIRAPLPGNIMLTRRAFFTPTFVLVRDGHELARIEGYPGEEFFWGLLGKMLSEHTEALGAS